MKKLRAILPLLLIPLSACGLGIDGDFDFAVTVNSEVNEYSDAGTVDPCSQEEVRDNADKLSRADIISIVMQITNVSADNRATTASVTGTVGGISQTIPNVAIDASADPVTFEFTPEEYSSLSEALVNCTPLDWTVQGEADQAPVIFDAVVTVQAEFEADAF
ncbi:MAG: hypothetical protein AAF654_03775 [Myxococcota bacterium]